MSEFAENFLGKVEAFQPVETEQNEWQKFLDKGELKAYTDAMNPSDDEQHFGIAQSAMGIAGIALLGACVVLGSGVAPFAYAMGMCIGSHLAGKEAEKLQNSRSEVREHTKDQALERMTSELKNNQPKIG